MKLETLNKPQFIETLTAWKVPGGYDYDFLYRLYEKANAALSQFFIAHPNNYIKYINPFLLMMYCIHEHAYLLTSGYLNKQFNEDEVYMSRIVSSALDKYLTSEYLEYKEIAIKTKFYPPMSSLKMYVNTINGLLATFKSSIPSQTLLTDIIKKAFSLLSCSLGLLLDGFETEAFSTWRTLHETEAVLILLYQYKDRAIEAYLTHLQYGLVFHQLLEDKQKSDQIFLEIKQKMKEHNLKSKDLKKYIEYGWLYQLVVNQDELRLNFRDGIQKLAKLEAYHRAYEMSSEITHSSPMLIYSKRQTFYDLTLIYLYETFFRIEAIFSDVFFNLLTKQGQNQYQNLRHVYYPQLQQFLKIEKNKIIKKKAN